jgi:hypothetical protein
MGRGPDVETGFFAVTGHQLLNRSDRQRPVTPILKEWRRGSRGKATRVVEGDDLADAGLGHPVERNYPTPGSFADRRRQVEILARLAIESDQVDDQPRAFPDAQTGMVEKQNQEVIPTPEGRFEIDHFENLTDF